MRSRSGRADAFSRPRCVTLRLALVAGLALVTTACGSEDDPAQSKQPTNVGPDECEGRGEPIVLGMTKTSDDGSLEVTLTHADPAPPTQGQNSWTVDVKLAGDPLVDDPKADDFRVIADIYMVDHDHDLRKRAVMTAPGVFELAEFPLTMSGYWELTVQAQSETDPDVLHEAVFGFCLPD